MMVHVDDTLVGTKGIAAMQRFKDSLATNFTMMGLGKAIFFKGGEKILNLTSTST